MTIADKLALLEQTKEAQRVKLGLPENVPFSQYHEFFEFKFVPSYLFVNGEQGVWFDPSDLSTMFQDVNGIEPVTKDGDPVALIKDKSGNGNHATQITSTARPIYRTDGELHWLEFDGVDDGLLSASFVVNYAEFMLSMAVMRNSSGIPLQAVSRELYIYAGNRSAVGDGWSFGTKFAPNDVFRKTVFGYPDGTKSVLSICLSNTYEARINSIVEFQEEVPNSLQSSTEALSIGRRDIDMFVTRCRVYGIILVSQNVSGVIGVEQYLATKAGVTL